LRKAGSSGAKGVWEAINDFRRDNDGEEGGSVVIDAEAGGPLEKLEDLLCCRYSSRSALNEDQGIVRITVENAFPFSR
jgi:hypothetical protein